MPALFLFVICGVCAVVFWQGRGSGEVGAEEAGETKRHGMPERREREVRVPVSLPPVEEVYRIEDGGSEKGFRLALDEIAVRDADGKERIVPLQPAATREGYASRVKGFAKEGEVLPVFYPEGEERTVYNRRLVTSSVLVEASEGSDRAALPAALKMPVEMMPEASPAHVVVKAPSPLAALAGVAGWRNFSGVKSVQVLLARQQVKRDMPSDPMIGAQWHLKFQNQSGAVSGTDVNIEGAWNYPSTVTGTYVRGSGIRIGIVDDGLQTNHPDFVGNIDTTNDWDWNGNDNDPSPGSGDDHGTSCAGNAAAKGNNGVGVAGTAPDATLVGMRLIAASTTDAQEAAAMGYLNDLIYVKSNSWGPSDDGVTLEGPGTLTKAAFANAVANGRAGKGTIILWAGGNGGNAGDNSNYDGYANLPETIAIGASDSQGNRAYYSEPGANLIVCAPSSGSSPALGITTVDRTGSNGYNTSSTANGGDYCDDFGGTSSATPTAAGITALMIGKNPNLGWRDVQEILIRSARKIKSSDSGWANNSAGFHFHHDFGAGLIDATAAVQMAGTWTNLGTRISQAVPQSGLSVSIPNNNTTGITRTFAVTQNIRAEHVTVRLTINHTARGNLAITLTSPSGMQSRLTETHTDTNDNYSNWTFMTTRTWGETATGNWTLKIADLSSSGNSNGGTLTAAELTVFGSEGTPTNPAPVVQITDPANGAVFSPGATVQVNVTATDTVIGGGAGVVSSVQLLDNGSVIATRTSAPYAFSITPALGAHALVARATDSEGLAADSATVNITLVNQPPVITAASIGDAFGFDDTPVNVTGVVASDPDGTVPVISYQWQSSADGVTYANVSGLTAATLPADASRSGLKWRCALTASDGTATSAAFYTSAVNLLDRPVTSAAAGTTYSYQSGLVLRSGGTGAERDAIINEFSQGPSGGTSEWVEILVLRQTSLRGWSLSDAAGVRVTFSNVSSWDNVPAGTCIVIYNAVSKDALLPADDTDFSDGTMILPHNDASRFATTTWPALGNGGDGIYLRNSADTVIAKIGYGNDVGTGINVGAVGGGRSAYYAGNSDAGASVASNWTTTTSTVARSVKAIRAAGDLFISEYVEGSSNNRALEFYNPSAGSVDLSADGYKIELYVNGGTSANTTINLSGTVASGATFVLANSSSTVPTSVSNQRHGGLSFTGNDAVVLKKGTVIVDVVGRIGQDPGAGGWTGGGLATTDRTLRRKSTVLQGDVDAYDAFDPSVEWEGFPINTIDGLGSHTAGSVNPSFFLTVSPSSFSESAGANAATGTVTLASAPASNLVVSLSSSDTTEATVPATVTVPAGQTSATFAVAAVDDTDSDGSQNVTITATTAGFTDATYVITVTDDEVVLEGVTPGKGNNAANVAWIATLKSGTAGNPALYRLAAGSSLPSDLVLDPETGLISGTVSGAASGTFSVVIERYNSIGETVSQSFTLTVSNAGGYPVWIGGFAGIADPSETGDADGDGILNLVEYFLGLVPNAKDASGALAMANTGSELSLTFPRSLSATGITAVVEWSDTLVTGSWSTTGVTESILSTGATSQLVKASLALSPGEPKKFIRIRVTRP